MKCMVTGGAGFIGSNLVDKLLSMNHKVVVVDNFSTGNEKNIEHHKKNPNFKIINADICGDISNLFREEKFDAIFHLAAIVSVPYSIENPDKTFKINVEGTINLLELCRKNNVKRFIFSSSCSVYGDQDSLPLVETMKPNPISPYALSKLVGEQYCRLHHFLYGMECISLRYFNVYGPRQNPAGEYSCLIPKFIRMIKEGKAPKINGTGEQTRDFIFVSDVVGANLAALNAENASCFGDIFNIGTERKISVNEVTSSIIKISGSGIKPIHGPEVIEPKEALAGITKAKSILHWSPKFSFEDGLRETYKFFL